MRAAFAWLFAPLVACVGAAPRPAEVPIWERPGLGGAVRPEMGSPSTGDTAPDFELPRLDGATMRLSSLRGSWVLLHFTASWCPYCDSEIAQLGALSDSYAPRGVRVVVVDVKEEAAVWQAYARAHIASSVIALHDIAGDASKRFAPPRAQPSFEDRAQVVLDSTLILDAKGTIRLFVMPDSAHFDPTFAAVRRELDRFLAAEPRTFEAAAEVTPPEGVVDIAASASKTEVLVTLKVRRGYHVMSNQPSQTNYIATRVRLDADDDVDLEPPVYPPPVPFSLGERSIATFAGNVEVRIPCRARGGAIAGSRPWKVTVRYQACTSTLCLFPVTRSIAVSFPAQP
jgi:peroxiredoxin